MAKQRHLSPLLALIVGIVACTEASPSLAASYTSEREREHAREDPDYAERLRRADSLARLVDTDSLRALYLRLMDSQPSERVAIGHEILCKISGQMIRYSTAVAIRAQHHLKDSLLAQPGGPERWARGQTVEAHTMTTAGCNYDIPPATGNIGNLPEPNVLR